MKTTELIELQKAITQGEWRPYNLRNGRILNTWSVCNRDASRIAKIEAMPGQSSEEEYANAQAISLVPSLLREVVELRKGLARLLDERIVCDSADDQEFDEKGNFTCNSPACIHARSLLSTHN